MDNFLNSFNEHAESLREERKQDDFDNLQHSLSGVQTGQQTRHGLSKDTSGSVFGDKRKSITEQIRETLEWLLLNNQAYAEAHEAAMTSLRSAETTVTNALESLLANLEREQAIFNGMLERASTLPDGQKVFRDAEGLVKTLDGEIIDNDLAGTIQWRGDEPSYEEITQQKTHVDDLKEGINEVRGIEAELGGIRGELTNNEKPPTLERADELKERIGELQEQTKSRLNSDLGGSIKNENNEKVGFSLSAAKAIPSMSSN
ncbi:hypothetical protein NBRC116602_03820 [Hyphomicrobiales bacterium 4NK60-0047b]